MRRSKRNKKETPGFDRARPRALRAARAAADNGDNPSRRSARGKGGPARKRGGFLSAIGLGLIFVMLALAGLGFAGMGNARRELDALRAQRLAQRVAHEKDVGYYVQMRRASGYEDIISKYAAEYSVDASFISAIIARESHYDPVAQSRVGARGLMQVMQDTGDWIGGRLNIQGYTYDSLYDPDLNIRFGAWYLNYLSSQFEGDPVMVAAAYHAGANNVKLWALKYGGEQGKRVTLEQIPTDDTRDYVGKVMNAYALFYEYDSGNFYQAGTP